MHRDLAGLSATAAMSCRNSSDHYRNLGDPDLVASAIRDVVQCARVRCAPRGKLAGRLRP